MKKKVSFLGKLSCFSRGCSRKSGGVLLIIGIVVLVLVVLVVGAVIYFYNFYVFETVRICVGEVNDTETVCGVKQDCYDLADEYDVDLAAELDDAPDFIKDSFQEVIDESVYCNGTCFVKEIRGIDYDTKALEYLENCEVGEVEFVVEIRGKEGLEVWNWMKERESV